MNLSLRSRGLAQRAAPPDPNVSTIMSDRNQSLRRATGAADERTRRGQKRTTVFPLLRTRLPEKFIMATVEANLHFNRAQTFNLTHFQLRPRRTNDYAPRLRISRELETRRTHMTWACKFDDLGIRRCSIEINGFFFSRPQIESGRKLIPPFTSCAPAETATFLRRRQQN